MMKEFIPYVQYLETMATQSSNLIDEFKHQFSLALDGGPGKALCRVIDLDMRRQIGAFFTGRVLARKVLAKPGPNVNDVLFFDPACGVGDLLLAAARFLPIGASLQSTMKIWGKRLAGCDAQPEFVRVAKARLVLLALLRGASTDNTLFDLRSAFPLIRVGNGLKRIKLYSTASWIIVNPPYRYVMAPERCDWASGQVTEASVFFEACIRNSCPGTRITGILPDVLRSGTRYEKWRHLVSEESIVNRLQPHGLFDHQADVDVFILDVVKQSRTKCLQKILWPTSNTSSTETIGKRFSVHVGSVVPHRHKRTGTLSSFIHARSIPAWTRIDRISEKRRFMGRLFTPPFVVIRRTSRPGDKHRAIGTLITGRRQVAVENHLIVCRPYDGTLKSCRQLLRRLKHKQTTGWLNSRIRCRHLTISAIQELPFMEASEVSARRRL